MASHGLFRYTVIGGLATAVHYSLLAALVELGNWPASPSAALGALAGTAVAYAGNHLFTFKSRPAPHGRAVPRFLAVASIGASMGGLIVWGGTALGVHYFIAQAAATVCAVLLTYRLNRFWTFA